MIFLRKRASSRLRYKMQLQRSFETVDDSGGFTRSWKTVANIWAEIMPGTGREKWLADKLQSEVTHRLLIRPISAGIFSDDRLVHDKKIYDVKYIMPHEGGRELLEVGAITGATD